MRIAVDARLTQGGNERCEFIKEVFSRLVLQYPTSDFVFFFDEPNGAFINSSNASSVVLTPRPTGFVSYLWWYFVKLPFALRRAKADVVIGAHGYVSLSTTLKQVIIMHDLFWMQERINVFHQSNLFSKIFAARFLKKASVICTPSPSAKSALIARYNLNQSAIQIIGRDTSAFYQPLDWEQRETIKQQVADGCEYFLLAQELDSKSNFLNVLKAFSIFKKWQKSNMKLVVIHNGDAAFDKELKKLSSYKFRSDVIIKKPDLTGDMVNVLAASYALIYPSLQKDFAVKVLQALRCNVAVIASTHNSTSDIAGDAALYMDETKPATIADQMKTIYKDEMLRSNLIKAGNLRSQLFSWNETANLLWQAIEQAVCK